MFSFPKIYLFLYCQPMYQVGEYNSDFLNTFKNLFKFCFLLYDLTQFYKKIAYPFFIEFFYRIFLESFLSLCIMSHVNSRVFLYILLFYRIYFFIFVLYLFIIDILPINKFRGITVRFGKLL